MTLALFPDLDPAVQAERRFAEQTIHARALIADGAKVVVSTSGGKDSQAMLIALAATVPRHQLVAVTADLGRAEWPDAVATARAQADALGIEHHVTLPVRPLLESIERRGRWPAMGTRYCTSDHKRAPIWRFIRQRFGQSGGVILSAVGERWAENSHPGADTCARPSCRCHREVLEPLDGLTLRNGARTVYTWRPVLAMSTEQVFATIRRAGQQPHPLYAKGLRRFSCSFCVFGALGDLRLARAERPDLYAELVSLEARMGHTFRHGFRLADLDAAADDGQIGPP